MVKKKFESNVQFQGAGENLPGFSDRYFEVPDLTPYLRANKESLMKDYELSANEGLAKLRLEQKRDEVVHRHNDRVNALLDKREVQNLTDFSKSLTGMLQQHIDTRFEDAQYAEIRQEWVNRNLGEGNESLYNQVFENRKVESQQVGTMLNNGFPSSSIYKFQNTTGNKSFIAQRLNIQHLAATIPGWMQGEGLEAKRDITYGGDARIIKLIKDLDPDFELIDPNTGQPKLFSLSRPGEFSGSAATTTIHRLLNEHRINEVLHSVSHLPPKLLNRYLFPKLLEADTANTIELEKNNRALIVQEREEQSEKLFESSLKLNEGHLVYQQELQVLTQLYGGSSAARDRAEGKLLETYVDNIRNGYVDSVEHEQFMDQKVTRNDGAVVTMRELIGHKLDTRYNMQEIIKEGQKNYATAKAEEVQGANAVLQSHFDQLLAEGVVLNEDQIKAITALHMERNPTIYTDGSLPEPALNAITQLTTNQNLEGYDWEAAINYRKAKRGGFLLPEDLANAPANIRDAFKDDVRDEFAPDDDMVTKIEGMARSIAKTKFTQEGLLFDATAQIYSDLLTEDFLNEFVKAREGQASPGSAYKIALSAVMAKSKLQDDENPYMSAELQEPIKRSLETLASAKTALLESKDINVKIKGLDTEIQLAKEWHDNGGKGEIPSLFTELAQAFRGTTPGGVTGYEMMAAQFKAYGLGDIALPKVIQDFKQNVSPLTQRNINGYQTQSTITRSIYDDPKMIKILNIKPEEIKLKTINRNKIFQPSLNTTVKINNNNKSVSNHWSNQDDVTIFGGSY